MRDLELLRFVHHSVRHAILERSLLTFHFGTTFLLILTVERLVVYESALEEVSVGKVETTPDQIVFEHEAVKEGTIYVRLFGLASLLVFKLSSFKVIFFDIYLTSDCLDRVRHVLWVVCKRLSFRQFERLYNLVGRCWHALLGLIRYFLEGNGAESSKEFLLDFWICLNHLILKCLLVLTVCLAKNRDLFFMI